MAFTKVSNLTPKDYDKPGPYLIELDKDMSKVATYLGNGISADVVCGTVAGKIRTLHIRNGMIQGYTDV